MGKYIHQSIATWEEDYKQQHYNTTTKQLHSARAWSTHSRKEVPVDEASDLSADSVHRMVVRRSTLCCYIEKISTLFHHLNTSRNIVFYIDSEEQFQFCMCKYFKDFNFHERYEMYLNFTFVVMPKAGM